MYSMNTRGCPPGGFPEWRKITEIMDTDEFLGSKTGYQFCVETRNRLEQIEGRRPKVAMWLSSKDDRWKCMVIDLCEPKFLKPLWEEWQS